MVNDEPPSLELVESADRCRPAVAGLLNAEDGRWKGVKLVVFGLIPIEVNGLLTGSFSKSSSSS